MWGFWLGQPDFGAVSGICSLTSQESHLNARLCWPPNQSSPTSWIELSILLWETAGRNQPATENRPRHPPIPRLLKSPSAIWKRRPQRAPPRQRWIKIKPQSGKRPPPCVFLNCFRSFSANIFSKWRFSGQNRPVKISGMLPNHRASCEIEYKCILAHANRFWYRPVQRYAGRKTTRKFR